jgi:acetyltransferase-like isoleucine patch superfamily enzyme
MVEAVHGLKTITPDAQADLDLAAELRRTHSPDALLSLASHHAYRHGEEDARMRRILWRAMTRRFGNGVVIAEAAIVKHPETIEIGDGVFIGEQAFIQGRFDGSCIIGNHAWIGPQAYFDALDLVIGDHVGRGPGAKVLGSVHTGIPADVPVVQTDLRIAPVRIGAWADIGVNAVILPGITIGTGAIVGAGAVVTHVVEPFAVVAGVPAAFL